MRFDTITVTSARLTLSVEMEKSGGEGGEGRVSSKNGTRWTALRSVGCVRCVRLGRRTRVESKNYVHRRNLTVVDSVARSEIGPVLNLRTRMLAPALSPFIDHRARRRTRRREAADSDSAGIARVQILARTLRSKRKAATLIQRTYLKLTTCKLLSI